MISEFPLFVFTLLGGAAAGAYAFLPIYSPEKEGRPWLAPLAALLLLAVGGIALLTHLGHAERMFYAFSNPTSGITLEGYSMITFGILAVADLVVCFAKKAPVAPLRIAAGVAGLLLLCAMGYAYASFAAVPEWGTWQTWLLFLSGNLALGSLLAALVSEDSSGNSKAMGASMAVLALAAFSLVVEAVLFNSLGRSVVPFVIGTLLVCASIAMLFARKKAAKWAVPGALVLAFIGIAVARYAFYAVM